MNTHLLETVNGLLEQELNESALLNLLIAVFDLTPNIMFVKDKDGKYLLANQALEEAMGLKQKDILGKTDFEIMSEAQAQECVESDLPARENKGQIASTIEFKHDKDGFIEKYVAVNKRVVETAFGDLLIGSVTEVNI